MSNLQVFQDIFQVDFPPEVADMILGRIQSIYGEQFENRIVGDKTPEQLKALACEIFDGLTPDDLKRGVMRMRSEKWCPNLPEFRTWCMAENSWWSADLAWTRAINFLDNKTVQITVIAKNALDEVKQILLNEGQKTAHFAFRDVYNNLVSQAQQGGQTQVFYDVATDQAQSAKDTKYKADQPNLLEHLNSQMSDDEQAILGRVKDLITEGVEPRVARKKATDEYYALKNKTAGNANKIVPLKRSMQEKTTPYHDMVKSGMSAVEAFKKTMEVRA